MTKEEKALKNDVLDILEDYLSIAKRFNRGDMLSSKAGTLDDDIKETQEIIYRLRDATITEEK